MATQMQIGVCTISTKSRSIESIIDICGELGVGGVEIWGEGHIGDKSPESCRSIAASANEREVSIPVYGSYLRLGGDEFDEEMETELEIADHLGADLIRVWAGEQEYQNCTEAHWERVLRDLERLGGAARDRELAVTVERHSGTVTNETEGAKMLIEAADSPAIGLNWQPLFEHDSETVADDVRQLADLVNNVHLQAVPAPGESDRCALSDAYFDVADVVQTFDESGFEGFYEIEFVTQRAPYHAALASDLAFVQALL